jgi:hypothetical protein
MPGHLLDGIEYTQYIRNVDQRPGRSLIARESWSVMNPLAFVLLLRLTRVEEFWKDYMILL